MALGVSTWARLGSAGANPGLEARATALMKFARRWEGTPYRFGGTGRAGIDCSAYVQRMYREIFRVDLPAVDGGPDSVGATDCARSSESPSGSASR